MDKDSDPKKPSSTTTPPKTGNWGFAIGLYRSGMPMSGVPGSYNSYTYNAAGEIASTVNRVPLRQSFGEALRTGDVVGCGWDVRRKRVYFTRNGVLIKGAAGSRDAFEGVQGFFFPAVWSQNAGATVSVNFGQAPWRFDFRSTLPKSYLDQLADAERKGDTKNWKVSEAEIRRKTAAEELVVMMQIYPRELCEVALERCQDDMQHAANWLIENGSRELELMTANMIRASEIDAEKRQLQAAGVAVDDSAGGGGAACDSDDEDLADWLTGNESAAGGDPQRRRQQAAASFLDDEIEQEVPLGVERKEIRRQDSGGGGGGARGGGAAQRRREQQQREAAAGDAEQVELVYDNLKIEDVHPGQSVAVCAQAPSIAGHTLGSEADRKHLAAAAGRIGVVAAVEINCKAVQVLFSRLDSGALFCLWLPLQVLRRPAGQWQDPCLALAGEPWDAIASKFVDVEQALSVRMLRGAVASLVAQKWPESAPFSLPALGGAPAVMAILKLAAAEMLSTVLSDKKGAGGGGPSVPLLDAFRGKILRIVSDEWKAIGQDSTKLPPAVSVDQASEAVRSGKAPQPQQPQTRGTGKCSLIQTLINECVTHFVQAVHHPPPVLVFKSQHPYKSHEEVREEVHIPGASKLLVSFDSRCHLSNDLLTRLSFYRDPEYQDLVSHNNGRGAQRYPSFVVPGDRLWFKFASGTNNNLWGYKFKVKPLELRLDDGQALGSKNFELGRWLFELFLTRMPPKITERYILELYDSVTHYVIQSKPSMKIRGVKLLIRFLLHVHRIPKLQLSLLMGRMARVPDFKKLRPLTQEMDAVMGSININRTLHSQTLQVLMELLATADLVQKDFKISKRLVEASDGKAVDAAEAAASEGRRVNASLFKAMDASRVNSRRIVINEAKYGPAGASASDPKNIDITNALRSYVERMGGTQLVIPRSAKDLSQLKPFSIDPAPGRDKRLRVVYSVESVDVSGGGELKSCELKSGLKRSIVIQGAPGASKTGVEVGEPTHAIIDACPTLFERVVSVSRFTLASHAAAGAGDEKTQDAPGDAKKAPEVKARWGSGNVVASEELLKQTLRLWAAQGGYSQLVPATGAGVTLSPNSQMGFPGPANLSNRFTIAFWVYLPKAPGGKKDKKAVFRSLLHRGVHVGVQQPNAQKMPFHHHMQQRDPSRMSLSLVLGPRDNKLSLCYYAAGRPYSIPVRALPTKRWTHVAVVSLGNSVTFFFDGKPISQAQLPRPLPRDEGIVLIGKPIAGVPPAALWAMGGPPGMPPASAQDSKALLSAAGTLRDVRWYPAALDKKQVAAIHACAKSSKTTQLKGLRVSPGADAKGSFVSAAHFAAIEALAAEESVRCEGKNGDTGGTEALNLRVWSSWGGWTPKMDAQLIQLFTEVAELDQKARGVAKLGSLPSLLDLPARTVPIPDKSLRSYHHLEGVPEQSLRLRFLFIQLLNRRISAVLPMVDFSQALSTWSLAHRLSALSHLIFLEIKNIAWTHILSQTRAGRGAYVTLNQPRALKAQERGDRSGRKSIFFQLYLQLHFSKPSLLRTGSDSRPWVVNYQGFGGQDVGGLFRDSVSTICSELQSKWVPLLIPVPNSRDGGVGDNQEKWIPSPGCRSSLDLSNYAFIGKLMGVAIRGAHMLNLDLPSIVWKPLVGEEITLADVKAIDVVSYKQIEDLAAAGSGASTVTADNFSSFVPDRFVMNGYDQKTVELKEEDKEGGGAAAAPTWETRDEYVTLLREAKLAELNPQVQAIRKGLGTIVPIQLLPLFTWQELECMVCGKREIDVDYLKANTRYRAPVKETDAHIKMFWEVLREFSHEERRLFLRFVWGQSRLPYNPADFTQKFEILSARDNSNGALPVSHTCFFSVELPKYTKKESMREKILYAVVNCQSIDTDRAANNVDWDAE